MGIYKAIHQTKFRNPHNKAMINIIFTHGWMMEKIKDFVKKDNITPQQYNILRILRGAGNPLSILQIRERLLDKMSDTSRIVDRMILKGLVTKSVSMTDKRLVDITITPTGSELLQKLDARNDELDNYMRSLTEEEAEQLSILLDKLRNHH
jgi:DNA-binding MarR family transcriptional regulator